MIRSSRESLAYLGFLGPTSLPVQLYAAIEAMDEPVVDR